MSTNTTSLEIQCWMDEGFLRFLEALEGSVAVTTYQAGKLVLLGWNGTKCNVLLREFERPMGLAFRSGAMALATRTDLVFLADAPLLAASFRGVQGDRYDSLWIPRATYHTGDLDLHELDFDATGNLWAVNTRFSCLCGMSPRYNFVPRWKPPFVSDLAPEDRCHLNGLAMVAGQPGYVTCFSETDQAEAWRPAKTDGGCVVDVRTNEVVLRGLHMPHSPRWHEGRLWLLNSGAGELLQVNPATGHKEVVARLPGYVRGLDFSGDHALVGMSMARDETMPVFEGLPEVVCGLAVIHVRTGAIAGMFRFTAACTEVFDVRVIPGFRCPMVLNRERKECQEAFTGPGFAFRIRKDPG